MRKFKKKIIPRNYFWLSIEGTDAVGKTTLIEKVETFLRNQRKVNFAIIENLVFKLNHEVVSSNPDLKNSFPAVGEGIEPSGL